MAATSFHIQSAGILVYLEYIRLMARILLSRSDNCKDELKDRKGGYVMISEDCFSFTPPQARVNLRQRRDM